MTDEPRLPRLPPLPDDATQETVEAAVPPPSPSRPVPQPAHATVDPEREPTVDDRRARRRVVDGRRLHSAGHGLLVAFLALIIGALLNAPGIYKTAYNQNDGWQRDVALGLAGPLDDISGALQFDEPRSALKAVLGRDEDDTIETVVVVAPPPKTSKPKPVGKTTFTPEKKLRVWVAGDSLIVVPGQSILGAAGGSPVMEPLGAVDGRIATGLERPDVFNWFTHVTEKMKELKPNVVVLGFGGNDDHGYMTGLPEGTEIDGFGLPGWEREYRRRVGGLMDTVNRAGGYVVWVGLPITRDADQSRRFDVLNAIYQTEAKKRPRGATYLDTYVNFADDSGGFSEYLPNASGRLIKMRAADGVHFERAGGEEIARMVLKRLNERFDLTSWRRAQTP